MSVSRIKLSNRLVAEFPDASFPWIGVDVTANGQRVVIDYKNCDEEELRRFCRKNWPDIVFFYFDKT